MEKLTVTEVVKTQEVSGKFGPQIRSAFKTQEHGDRIFSAFSKYAIKVGQEIEGTVEEQEKDGKTFHNFKFAPRNASAAPSGDLNRVERKVDAIITELQLLRGLIGGKKETDDWADVPF